MADTANTRIVQFITVRKYETTMKNIYTHIFIIRSPGSKMSQVPLSFCVPSGSVSPAALRLAHYFRIALFLGPIDYIMLCKYTYEENCDNSYRIISTGGSTGEQLDLHL